MGLYLTAALAAFAAAFADGASAQAPPSLPSEVAAAIQQWGVCQGRFLAERSQGPESAEALVAEALKQCEPEQAKARDLASKALGPSAAALVDQQVSNARAQGIEMVNRRRSGAADGTRAWGACLQEWTREPAPTSGGVDGLVDQSLARCKAEEQQAMTALEGRVGHDEAVRLVEQARRLFRDDVHVVIDHVRQNR